MNHRVPGADDEVAGVLLRHHAPHLSGADDRRVVLGGPAREVALDVGVRAARKRLDRRAVAIGVTGPRARVNQRGEATALLTLGLRRPREPRVDREGAAERQEVAVRTRGVAVRDIPGDPGGLIEDRLRRRRAIKKRHHDVPLDVAHVAADRDHRVVPLFRADTTRVPCPAARGGFPGGAQMHGFHLTCAFPSHSEWPNGQHSGLLSNREAGALMIMPQPSVGSQRPPAMCPRSSRKKSVPGSRLDQRTLPALARRGASARAPSAGASAEQAPQNSTARHRFAADGRF